jgi:predicted phosphodiesterase
MRYLVLSDIHSNLEALDAVFDAVSRRHYDALLILGDFVGYGADPNAVLERVRRERPLVSIRGNHDKVAAGVEEPDGFNHTARIAAAWTQQALTLENRDYLRALPKGPCLIDGDLEICHGSPLDEDQYIFDNLDALRALQATRRPVCLFGHTHVPTLAAIGDSAPLTLEGTQGQAEVELTIEPGWKYLINPGSVGQPRDGDSRAAYAIADLGRRRVTLFRVAYPISIAQEKILAAGLPPTLAQRLEVGR